MTADQETPIAGHEAARQRYEREQAFHDKIFGDDARRRVGKFYAVTRASRNHFLDLIHRHGVGKCVLEYGCGPGSYAAYFARRGSTVTAIDLSAVAIAQGREWAAAEGLTSIDFRVMNAEELAFPDDSFDLVCGTAILHHLDLERAFAGIARTLKPGGTAVFLEPLGHNPAINLYRRLTPALRTPDEHPLMVQDLAGAGSFFESVETRFFTLHSLLAVPLRGLPIFSGVLRACDALDVALFTLLPFTRRHAWQVVVTLSKPRKR